ncbi:MAG: NAD(P)/FAD-dependent oxidoreductase [Alphaproteobacteria bacterium]
MTQIVGIYDVIILGGGAAGLMAAGRAGQRGRRVLLLERGQKIGAKILISGGGRCNFTNLHTAPERFISSNPHFCKSALKNYSQQDFIALVTRHKIPYHEKTLGQLFCDNSAQAITTMLLEECRAGSVDIRTGQNIDTINKSGVFSVCTQDATYHAPALILATGGLSIPKLGATDLSYRLAQKFGLEIIAPRPGLVPFTFADETLAMMQALTGTSLEVVASCARMRFREAMVFTHHGLSGPAILQASSYWHESMPITLDLAPDTDITAYLRDNKNIRPKSTLKTTLATLLPQRLALAWVTHHTDNPIIGTCTDKKLHDIAQELQTWTLHPSGTEGYIKAEVTVGGIDTRALSSKTMMANAVPGLFIVGEAMDVTGWLGGYNFQWAWSSGWAAGSAV